MRRNIKKVLEGVRVESVAAEGKSLARQEGKVIFIEGAVPGDLVDVQLTRSKKDWAEGYPVRFREYSDLRVTPFCRHFGVCGGCQWQMLPYEQQLLYKQQQVVDHLTRIGKVALPPFEPIAGAPETRFYRNKLEYTFSASEYVPKEEFQLRRASGPLSEGGGHPAGVLGFHAKGFFDKVVNIGECWLQGEPTNALRNGLREYALQKGYSFYDYRAHEGLLRNLQVRVCRTGEVMVNLVLGRDDEGAREDLLQWISTSFPDITTLLYTINEKRNDSLFDLEPVTWKGPGYITETLEDFRFKIGPKSFFQTNTAQAETLYRITREYAELTGSEVVYDLYCGTGSIGIFCSRNAGRIVGVEVVEAAVRDAEENARHNGIERARFFAGDVIDICNDDFFAAHGRPDVIITDPPRAGMHAKLVEKILEMRAPTVVYVSCNPATQARDLALLDAAYAVTRVKPVDMFPHTHHIENVVQLKLKP